MADQQFTAAGVGVAAVHAVLSGLINWGLTLALRPVTQKFESKGWLNLNCRDIAGQYGVDLVYEQAKCDYTPATGRDAQIEELIAALLRGECPCVIGEAGVGKTALIEALAWKIAHGQVPDEIKDWEIIKIDFPSLIVGKGYGGGNADGIIRLRAVFEYAAEHPNVVIFIDEMHLFANYADLCKTYFDRGQLKLVGATTLKEFEVNISKDPALERRFTKITLEEPTLEQSFEILKSYSERLEKEYGVKIPVRVLATVVELTERYCPTRRKPDRDVKMLKAAVELASRDQELRDKVEAENAERAEKEGLIEKEIESSITHGMIDWFSGRKSKKIKVKYQALENPSLIELSEKHVRQVIASSINMHTVNPLTPQEYMKLITLPKRIKSILYGQDSAVDSMCESIRKARIELNRADKIKGAFLFAGPAGVGKTYLAELLGSEIGDLIIIDVTQYDEKMRNNLIYTIKNRPNVVLVFDGLEKASVAVRSELATLLDTGVLLDSQGLKVNFRNTLLIMTANTGDTAKTQDEVKKVIKEKVGDAITNRVDDVLIFNSITDEIAHKLASRHLAEIDYTFRSRFNVELDYSEQITSNIAARGLDPARGAWGIVGYCDKVIVDFASNGIMTGSLGLGDKIVLSVVNGEVKASVVKAPKKSEEKEEPKQIERRHDQNPNSDSDNSSKDGDLSSHSDLDEQENESNDEIQSDSLERQNGVENAEAKQEEN